MAAKHLKRFFEFRRRNNMFNTFPQQANYNLHGPGVLAITIVSLQMEF